MPRVDFSGGYDAEPSGSVWRDIFGVLSRGQKSDLATDGVGANRHSVKDIKEVQELTYSHIAAERLASGEDCRSLGEVRQLMVDKTGAVLGRIRDGMENPISGVQTLSDPSVFTYATLPVSISPMEATAIYASGGLPQIIVDKKSKGILQNGLTFKTHDEKFWTDKKIEELVNYAFKSGFETAAENGFRDGTIYGGSMVFPIFDGDGAYTFSLGMEELVGRGIIGKGKINHWVEVDRWNTTFIPNYNISAEDYLHPKHIYVPISGIDVNTERAAVIRPRQLPYWGAMMQMGWGVSDYEGWMAAYYSLEMVEMSIPIMAQQMSLLLYQMPLDALQAQLGATTVKELMKINESQLREWSILNPKAVNMVGEVVTVNRTFSGFEHFLDGIITFFCSKCEMPRPLLFHTPTKGFADNTQESLLKESEMMRQRQKSVEPQMARLKDILVGCCFGTEGNEWANRGDVYLSFDKPVVATDKDKAEIAARMSATVNSLKQSGIPQDAAMELTKQFFPSMRIPIEVMEAAREAYEFEMETAKETLKVAKESAASKSNPGASATGGGGGAGKKAGKPAQIHGGSTTAKGRDGIVGRFRELFRKETGRDLSEREGMSIMGSIIEPIETGDE